MVTSSTSVPKTQIYPKFIRLSQKWDGFEELRKRQTEIAQLMSSLETYKSSFQSILKPSEVETAIQRFNSEEQNTTEQQQNDEAPPAESSEASTALDESAPVLRTEKEVAQKYKRIRLEYSGFCPYTLVKKGYLTHGVDSVGFVEYSNKLYRFVSKEAALAFIESPTQIVDGVIEAAKKSPELIYLLNLQEQIPPTFPASYDDVLFRSHGATIEEDFAADTAMDDRASMLSGSSIIVKKKPKPQMVDSEIQTEVHPIEKHIDYKYQWNEWELRRQAIKTVDLRNKKTHSAQTDESHFRRESETQVYLPKQQATQTAKDAATNPKKNVRVVTGLRGKPNTQMKVVNLTLDL